MHLAVKELMQQGKSDEEISALLVSKGYEKYYAEVIIQNIRIEKENNRKFRETLLYGTIFLAGGIVLNIASRSFAISSGSFVYFFFWGVIVTGITIIARAFILFRR